MKKIKLFPKIFLFTFAMMLLISFIAHLLIFLIAPAQNVLVTNILVTNAGASTLSEVDMPRLITQTMLKTFPISILCCAAISALFSYFFSRGITTPILSLSKSANQMLKLEPDAKAIVSSKDEIGALAIDINNLYQSLLLTIRNLELEKEKVSLAEKEKIDFLRTASHELKTPLAVVSSQVEMLEIAGDKIDRSYYYSSIHEELDKMSRMVGELLDFSMLDNQMSSMEMSRVNVSEMIEYLLLRYDAMFRKNEIKVEQEIEKNCFAYGNRMYLERAVNNYLMNAFQHTEQGKRIRITLKKEKKQIRMEVYNDGAQIKEEQMEHIWDSFYTTSQKKKPVTSENEVRNIGLGLFVVRKIVDKHKGSCGAQNLENGVLFWLQIPEIRELGK